MAVITLLNGPNLNLLGLRQPEIYGRDTIADVVIRLEEQARAAGHELRAVQSNHEGALIDAVQAARGTSSGIIINPGSLSHTSIGILDALHAFDGPVIEVHISNIHARESFRHHSYVSARANGVILGCGVQGYELALIRLLSLIKA